MGRSGYDDDVEQWSLIMWRGAVASSLRGRRGQAFLKEMLAAFDALPEKKLIAKELVEPDGAVCALGAVGKARAMDMQKIDAEDHESVAGKFNIAHAMACEIMFENDEGAGYWSNETPEHRFYRMRRWVESKIRRAHD